jgi:hypothetical protein
MCTRCANWQGKALKKRKFKETRESTIHEGTVQKGPQKDRKKESKLSSESPNTNA